MSTWTTPSTSSRSPASISEPERRAWYAAGAVLTVAAIGSTVFGLRWSPDQTEYQQQRYTQPVSEVVVKDMASGDVVVVSDSANGSVLVERRLNWDNDEANAKPVVAEELSDGVFSVTRDCPGGDDACSIDYVIHTPKTVAVTVQTASGDVDVEGVTGAVEVITTSGDVDATTVEGDLTAVSRSGDLGVQDITGDLELTTTSGDLNASSVNGDVQATTTSGDIKLAFDSPPNKVNAEATSGDIDVQLPDGFDYAIDASAASGDDDVYATNNPDSPRLITVTATSGDISIA